jgi:curli biogenesis system outer membrane secretion channel CsgG
MMRRLAVATLVLASVFSAQLSAQDKKRVAIMDFDYATVQSGVSGIFGRNVDVGKGIADMLVDRLVRDGTYSVIERKALDKILTEQNFSNSNRADPSSAAKIGKLLGVSVIVVGSITQFGRDDKKTSVGGGALGGITGRFGVGGVSKTESKAVVEVTARMVSVDTGEILAVAEGKGESQRGGTSLLGAGGGGGGAGGGGMDMSSSNFGATILGEATNKAVTSMAMEFDASAAKIPTVVIPVDGLVADVDGSKLVLNVGASSGLKAGQVLQVFRTGREIKDPATGKVIRRTETAVGSVTISSVDSGSSEGNFAGDTSPQVGDHVKR